jgi:hypothetical protein
MWSWPRLTGVGSVGSVARLVYVVYADIYVVAIEYDEINVRIPGETVTYPDSSSTYIGYTQE